MGVEQPQPGLTSTEIWVLRISAAASFVSQSFGVKRGFTAVADMIQGTSLSCSPVWLLGTCHEASSPAEDASTSGRGTAPEVLEAMRKDFGSRIWCTYRRGFPALGDGGFTSDVGWGCTLRSGQMLVAEALSRQLLGRSWRRDPDGPLPPDAQSVLALLQDYAADGAPLSIHSICAAGKDHGVLPGRWLGPWTLCKSLEAALRSSRPAGLQVYVVCDPGGGAPTLDVNRIRQQAFGQPALVEEQQQQQQQEQQHPGRQMDRPPGCQPGRHQQGEHSGQQGSLGASGPVRQEGGVGSASHDGKGENGASSRPASVHAADMETASSSQESLRSPRGEPGGQAAQQQQQQQQQQQDQLRGAAEQAAAPGSSGASHSARLGPLLLLIPLTLGVGKVHPLYFPQLKQVLTFPHSVGIVGGRPSSSLFFIGHHDDRLLYLDPHETQPAAPLPGAAPSYFCGTVRMMPITSMDPSLAIGFLCPTLEDFEDLCARLRRLCSEFPSAPLLTVALNSAASMSLDQYQSLEDEIYDRVEALASSSDGEADADGGLEEGEVVQAVSAADEGHERGEAAGVHGQDTRAVAESAVPAELGATPSRRRDEWEVVSHSTLGRDPGPWRATIRARKDGDRIVYSKEFLMQFMDKVVEVAESDDRDWRSRNDTEPLRKGGRDADSWEPPSEPQQRPAAAAKAPAEAAAAAATPSGAKEQAAPTKPAQQPAAPAAAPARPQAAGTGEIQRASAVGVQAYRPGAAVSSEEKSVRQIKGILNKLTPEKFDRLLQQLLGVITTADVLRSTIAIVFENAVEQPTYCAMYADLCLQLSKELPSFPPPAGSDKPITFVQILLNTCQDEFEGAEEARAQLQSANAADMEDQERVVKKRVMGTMRLISELYKKDMVRDWIITTCLESLLAKEKGKSTAPEDSIEAACEMLTTAGQKVSKSENEKMRKKLEDVLKQLQAYEKDKNLSSRIRFVIRDLLDLRKSNWVPRRETFTAKKLDEVRAQAEAELGMVSSVLTASLPVLPAQQRMGAAGDDFTLIPPLKGDAEGWGFPAFGDGASSGQKKFGGGQSALLGDYKPPAAPAVVITQPAPSTASAEAGNGVQLTEEEAKRKTEALYAEYCSTLDKAEALTCVREINAPGFKPQLVEIGLTTMMNSVKDKEVTALEELLLHMHAQGLITTADIISGLGTFTVQLEDISLDVPKAPSILGHIVGSAVLQSILALDALPQLLEGDAGVEPKREFACAVFKRVQEQAGAEGLSEMCAKSGLKASAFLAADAALDPDAPAVEDFLRQQGLAGIVPV